jgi:outer membrane protein assembly factor BamD
MKYKKAFEYYNKEDYNKASALFDDIANVFRATSQADSVYFFQAMSYYKQRDYILAGHYFSTFYQNYLYSPFAEEAEYLAAYCFYKNSPNPSLDQTNTHQAIEAFRSYINRHLVSPRSKEAENLITELEDKLVEKSRLNAKLYYDMGNFKSAIIALKTSLDDYPNTKYREELMWLILDSSFQLAENSIFSKQKERYQSTVDEYYSFITQYPESKHKKEAEDIYKEAEKKSK